MNWIMRMGCGFITFTQVEIRVEMTRSRRCSAISETAVKKMQRIPPRKRSISLQKKRRSTRR